MARPVQADAAATRQRILDVASSLFSERGSGETSMRDIAGGAHVSLATVHHYFGGKEALYDASVDAMYQELEGLREELVPLFVEADDLSDAIGEGIKRTYAFAREHVPAVRLSMRVILESGELPEKRRRELLLPMLDEGQELFAQAIGSHPEQVRMGLLTLNYVIVRYALVAPRELVLVTGLSAEPSDDPKLYKKAIAKVEAHLIELARSALGIN